LPEVEKYMEKSGSVNELIMRIRSDSERESEEILSKARISAEEEKKQSQKRSENLCNGIMQRAEEEVARIAANKESSLDLEIRRLKMKAEDEIVSDVIRQIRMKCEEFRKTDEYGEFLERLLIEAVIGINGGEIKLILGKWEKEICNKVFLDNIAVQLKNKNGIEVNFQKVENEPNNLMGIKVCKDNGRIIYDNTLEAILYRKKELLRLIIQKNVFTED
jgi:V/A-type H+/Na+-transporting ATPase subunit E